MVLVGFGFVLFHFVLFFVGGVLVCSLKVNSGKSLVRTSIKACKLETFDQKC